MTNSAAVGQDAITGPGSRPGRESGPGGPEPAYRNDRTGGPHAGPGAPEGRGVPGVPGGPGVPGVVPGGPGVPGSPGVPGVPGDAGAAPGGRELPQHKDRASGPDAGPGRAGLVVAIDGPAGSGKSSAARGAACTLGLRYLDTGAMYRALTWWLLHHDVDVSSPDAVAGQARAAVIEVTTDPVTPGIRVDGIDVSAPIRTREVSNAVSAVARVPQVRDYLIGMQRQLIAGALAAGTGIVAEGRDIGTVVAPEAPVKVFLTASAAVRASRRSADLAADPGATVAVTQAEQARRDAADAAQMARADDAVEIDTTGLGLAEVIAEIAALAGSRTAGSWQN